MCIENVHHYYQIVYFQALNKAGQARQTAQDAAAKVADALAKVENISSILCKLFWLVVRKITYQFCDRTNKNH